MKVKVFTAGNEYANCYILSSEHDAVVIDPGCDAEGIYDYICVHNLNVHYILLTHRHYDHILAAPELRRLTGAPIVISVKDECGMLEPADSLAKQTKHSQTPASPDILANDEDVYSAGEMVIKCIATPGHTAGSVCYMCGDLLFSGDTLFAGSCGNPYLPTGDEKEIYKSLKKIAAFEGDYKVYPGHSVDTVLSYERLNNPEIIEACRL